MHFFLRKNPPHPLRQFQKFHEKSRKAKSQSFCIYKNVTQIVLLFPKSMDFCIYKRPATQSVMLFVYIYKCQFQEFHEKWCYVKCLAFREKNLTQVVLLFAKCLAFCIYIYKCFAICFAFCIYKNVHVVFCWWDWLLFTFIYAKLFFRDFLYKQRAKQSILFT